MPWKSPFSNDVDREEEPGRAAAWQAERERKWGSLLDVLESKCWNDDDDDAPAEAAAAEASIEGGGDESSEAAIREDSHAPPPESLAETDVAIGIGAGSADGFPSSNNRNLNSNSLYMQQLLLKGGRGAASNSDIGVDAGPGDEDEPTPPLPSSMPLSEWISFSAKEANAAPVRHDPQAYWGAVCGTINENYLEKSALIALSLAKILSAQYSTVPLSGGSTKCLQCGDIVMKNIFISSTEGWDADFIDVGRTTSCDEAEPIAPPSQRSAVHALGVIYYELFTRGLLPTGGRKHQPKVTLDPSLDKGKDDAHSHTNGRAKQPRQLSTDDVHSHYMNMQHAGVPPSLSRLVADMLENDGDNSISMLSDVVSDLESMADDPRSFLHNRFMLEPVIPTKLYGRDKELRECLDAVDSDGDSHFLAVMVSGHAGCGKSSLVEELTGNLQMIGWQCLRCKFDQEARHNTLSMIAVAYDRYFLEFVNTLDSDAKQEFKLSAISMLSEAGIDLNSQHNFIQLMPALRLLLREEEHHGQDQYSCEEDADLAVFRLHRLFVCLTRALSNEERPLLIIMDDLQWACPASLDLINSLTQGLCERESRTSRVKSMLVGCYRSDEGEASDVLGPCINKLKDCSTITFKHIQLEGLTSEEVNGLVSDSLFSPKRYTRSLSALVHQKTAGNPLHVKEFLNSIVTENLLTYSLSLSKWTYDEDLIRLITVSTGVADLLVQRLERLPVGVLPCLQVMSCFGFSVSVEVLVLVENVCGSDGILAKLEYASNELLVEEKNGSYSFAHDVIRETVYRGIGEQERLQMLKLIADKLIEKTGEMRKDGVLFSIVHLINRVGPEYACQEESKRAIYARLNLSAGEKSMHIPDYLSATNYFETGIKFLGDNSWRESYKLTLSLYKNVSLSLWALGKTYSMLEVTTKLLAEADCYEDKLDTYHLLIDYLYKIGDSIQKSFDTCFEVLQSLGQSFPETMDLKSIKYELTEARNAIHDLAPASIESLPVMVDKQKLQAMNFMSQALHVCHKMKSSLFFPIACRMVHLTLRWGICEHSAKGIGSVAVGYLTVLGDVTESYNLGKTARRLNKSQKVKYKLDLECHAISMINIYKEPMQSSSALLKDIQEMAMRNGDIRNAELVGVAYIRHAFFGGSSLGSLGEQIADWTRLMLCYKRVQLFLQIANVANAISALTGKQHLDDGSADYLDDDKNLVNAFEAKEHSIADNIITKELAISFIFRRMLKAESLVRQYFELLNLSRMTPVNDIFRAFYGGLIAFYMLRESQDKYWMAIGQQSLQKFEFWNNECVQNFSNKLCLLKAEYHFALGEVDEAERCYKASIECAKKYRLTHEEAIANELTCLFYKKTKRNDLAALFLGRSILCYEAWGADSKAQALRLSQE